MTKDQTPSPVVTREEIIRMAREAGIVVSSPDKDGVYFERFAALIASRVAAAAIHDDLLWQAETETAVLGEREACARIAEEPSATTYECTVACGGPAQTFTQRLPKDAHEIAAAIRARKENT